MSSSTKSTILLSSNRSRNWFYAGFIIINLFLSCYYLDIWVTPNTASRVAPVLTLYENKTLVIDKYVHYAVDVSAINHHYYSNKAPLSSFIVYPFYSLYKSTGLPELKDSTLKKYPIYILENLNPNTDGRVQLLPKSATVFILGDILCGVIPFVIILVLALFAIRSVSTNVLPVAAVMLTFYGSFLFAYAGTYTGHILAGFLALAGYILLKDKRYVFSGIIIGLAVAAEYPLGILIPVWMLLIYLNERKISRAFLFGAGVIPGLVIIFYYNYHLTGSIFNTTYSYEVNQHKNATQDVGFYFPKFSALWGLVFSTYRGILYYTPILLLMLWYTLKYGYQNVIKGMSNKWAFVKTGLKNYLLITILVYFLLYSAYYEWDGGWSYGPRYLIPVVIIVLYEGILFLSSKPFSAYVFYAVAGVGLIVTWMDKSTKIFQLPNNPVKFGNPVVDIIIPDFFKHKFNTNTIPVFCFNSNPVIAIYMWPLLFAAGLLVLAIWYSRVYHVKIRNASIYISVLPLLICYVVIIASQSIFSKNNLEVDTSGIYGAWPHYDLADKYRNAAQTSNDPKRKKQLYSLSAAEYRKIMQFLPADPDCNFYLGTCYFCEGYPDSAINAYKRALELNPKFSIAAKSLGMIYIDKKQYDSAMHYFFVSCRADSNIGALMDIGASYQQVGNYVMAMHYDSLVLEKDRNNRTVLINMNSMMNAIKKTPQH